MQYLLLIYAAESKTPVPETPEFDAMMAGFYAFSEEVSKDGVMNGGNPLDDVITATTVRVRNGATEITDGPFAETKEQLGGYYLLDCKNLDDALAYAAKIPAAQWGSVEVRPIALYDEG
ncbi:MAG: YciI family protein [Proteobacteria bacterium]|nr:YciI family protein [Pseudomonadota bacterium]